MITSLSWLICRRINQLHHFFRQKFSIYSNFYIRYTWNFNRLLINKRHSRQKSTHWLRSDSFFGLKATAQNWSLAAILQLWLNLAHSPNNNLLNYFHIFIIYLLKFWISFHFHYKLQNLKCSTLILYCARVDYTVMFYFNYVSLKKT